MSLNAPLSLFSVFFFGKNEADNTQGMCVNTHYAKTTSPYRVKFVGGGVRIDRKFFFQAVRCVMLFFEDIQPFFMTMMARTYVQY